MQILIPEDNSYEESVAKRLRFLYQGIELTADQALHSLLLCGEPVVLRSSVIAPDGTIESITIDHPYTY